MVSKSNNNMAQAHRFSKALVSLQPCHRLSVRAPFPSLPRISIPPRNPRLCITQRGLSVTSRRHAALAPSLPAQPTVVLCTPSPEYIEKEELDVELLPPEQVKLEITDRAAEVRIWPLLYITLCSQYHPAFVKNSRTRTKSRGCSQNFGGIRRMSRLSIQHEAGHWSLAR